MSKRPRLSSARSLVLLKVRSAIDVRLADPALDASSVARAAGVSVRYANAVLADEGTSIGQRKAIVEAEDWEGPAYQTCVNASNVARRFESNRRRLNLSFAHHAEVAALTTADANALLDWAEDARSSKRAALLFLSMGSVAR